MGATTWHTWFNHDGGCDQGGCGAGIDIGGQFHVKAEFGTDGWMHTYFNGNEIGGFNPYPSDNARDSVRDTMNSRGVVFSSSQWTGWVPGPGNVDGDVGNFSFPFTTIMSKFLAAQSRQNVVVDLHPLHPLQRQACVRTRSARTMTEPTCSRMPSTQTVLKIAVAIAPPPQVVRGTHGFIPAMNVG